jgi:hypothetical protein
MSKRKQNMVDIGILLILILIGVTGCTLLRRLNHNINNADTVRGEITTNSLHIEAK